ncbi:dTDP-4-amino-4,6-dideoxy-D-galactose acyltransferase [Martelella alba]|uniref:dTDP-4-amino-4,6-dideoxy-D-galactose acyltransferase n=1 Tax=Martelella alba TaxID=2590451 RepID=A0ABY2SGG8_9HYPH|nr:dTDP-4-amino-4,6-dideoxy-D-galactose acyltransferase [Martelella alba]TKI03897.1 dTDP-4-amino-4,6-dideoxy-D-galactose acyltransferase [Martelella alba]
MRVCGNIDLLRWESRFFGFSNARLVCDPAGPPVETQRLDAFAVVQAKVAADDPQQADALAALGFRLVEGEIDLGVRLTAPAGAAEWQACVAAGLRLAQRDDIPALRRLAATAFTLSRFREPWYRQEDNRRFYALWAENAVLGRFDHHCLVIGRSDAVLGMVTLRELGGGQMRIGLLAVDPAQKGRGYGRLLFQGALAWCRQQGRQGLRVATQTGNIAALRLYITCGANIDSAAYWFYR